MRLLKTTRRAKNALLLLCLLTLCAPAHAQRRGSRARKPATKRASPEYVARSLDSPTDGAVAGHTYTNKYFGLKINFPESWFVFNDVGKGELKENTKTILKPRTEMEQKAMESSLERTLNLLVVNQSLSATPEHPGANLLVVAELLPVLNMTAAQYADVTRATLVNGTSLKIKEISEPTPERLAGEDASMLTLKVEVAEGLIAQQEYHVVMRRGWALGFVLSYVDEKQHAQLTESLQSLAFERAAK